MEATLKVDIKDAEDGYQVVAFAGEFDKAGYSGIKTELTAFLKSFEKKSMIFDFSDLKFINSEGIGFLMELHTHLKKEAKHFVIVGSDDHILDIFETIGIKEVIPLHKNLKAYLQNKNK